MIRLRLYHILLALLTLLVVTPTQLEARSASRAKTSKQVRKKRKTTRRKTVRRSVASRQRAQQRVAAARLKFSQDSARIVLGGVERIPVGDHSSLLSSEPSFILLQRGDTTLTEDRMSHLYYTHRESDYERKIVKRLQERAHLQIEQHDFANALNTLRLGLWYCPMNLQMLKRSCDLALHVRDPLAQAYIWRLVTVLDIMARTGDGKSPERAIRVLCREDADLYESLWMDSDGRVVERREEHSPEGKHLYIVSVREGEGQETKHHYFAIEAGGAH